MGFVVNSAVYEHRDDFEVLTMSLVKSSGGSE